MSTVSSEIILRDPPANLISWTSFLLPLVSKAAVPVPGPTLTYLAFQRTSQGRCIIRLIERGKGENGDVQFPVPDSHQHPIWCLSFQKEKSAPVSALFELAAASGESVIVQSITGAAWMRGPDDGATECD